MTKTVGKKSIKQRTWRKWATVALALCAGAAAFAETPDKWVSYVEADGGQYVDTGIIGRWNTKIEAKVEWMDFSDSSFLAVRSEVYPGNGRLYFCYCRDADGRMYTAADTGESVVWGGGWEVRWEKDRIYPYTAEFSATNGEGQATNKINVDGNAVWSKASAGVNSGYNLYLFANNQKDNAVSNSKTRCYGLKIWQGPVDGGDMKLVRDFQPCMKDGRAGLYDTVTSNIFYSAVTSNLKCDENSEVPDEYIDYVESTGNAAFNYTDKQFPSYIDTGIIGRSGTKIVGEFALLQYEDGCLVGSRSGDTRFYMAHSYRERIACGYNTFHDNSYQCELGKQYGIETEFNAGSQVQKTWADGVTNTVYTGTEGAIDTKLPLYVFVCNVNGNPWVNQNDSMASRARCYGLEIWQDGVRVRNFKPCLKNGVAGLYDTVSGRIFYSAGTPLGFNNMKSEEKKNIVFVEYIESDGNTTLDTGIRARSGTRAKGEMTWAGPVGDNGKLRTWNQENYRYLESSASVFWRQKRAYLGARNIQNSKFFHFIHEADSTLISQYGGSGELFPQSGGSRITLLVGEKHSFDVTLANGSQTFDWDGVQVLSTNFTGDVDIGDTLHLFSSSYWRWRSVARCYGLQLWQDGTLVRNFKPCLVDGKGMLYDEVTQCIFRPSPDIPASRTGKIVLSGEEQPVRRVEYVESDGTIFVDTGVVGKSGTAADMEMSFLETGDKGFLESRKGNTRYYLFHNGNAKAMYGYTNWYYVPSAEGAGTQDANAGFAMTNGQKYHVESLMAEGTQSVKINGTQLLTASSSEKIDTGYNLGIFTCCYDGKPQYSGKGRLYWLKLYQGNTDGSNLQLVRDFRPVRLTNGLVVLWDFKNREPYLPQSVTAPYNYTTFPMVGPDGAEIRSGTMLFFH